MRRFLTLVLLITLPVVAASQVKQSCDRLDQLIAATYNFKPSKLSEAQQNLKASEMDIEGKPAKFAELVTAVPDVERDVVAVLKQEDLPLVRKVRRKIIASANQHAIEFYDSFTAILMTMTWSPSQ